MQRFFKWFVIGTLFLSILACSSTNDTASPTPAETSNAPTSQTDQQSEVATDTVKKPTQTPKSTNTPESPKILSGKVGDKVEAGGMAITVVQVQKVASFNSFMSADAGNIYVDIEVVIENTGRDETPYNPFYFKLKDAHSYEYDATFSSLIHPCNPVT